MTHHSNVRTVLAITLVALAVSIAPVGVSQAVGGQSQPSLADVAKKEAERRKTAKESTKVITAKDLPESARRPAPQPATTTADGAVEGKGGEQATAAAPAAPDAASAGSSDKTGEEQWRARIAQAREDLRRNQSFLLALQTRVNSLANDFAGRDDPIQRAKIAQERKDALQEQERVRADVELSRKAIADIEEEARKAGVPPGWLR
jgi:hypothetical protein